MEFIGQLVWWGVGSPTIDGHELQALLAAVGVSVPPPKPIVPADAFRRLTGDSKRSYTLGTGEKVTLDLHPARSQQTMLVRHIVRTVKRGNVVVAADRVGDCAFYKPPKGQNERARMRVTPHPPEGAVDQRQIEAFCSELREEYRRALTFLDPQAIRRLVRQYLSTVHALYLDGPYFLPEDEDAERLCDLLERIGGGSTCHVVPVVDDQRRRAMVTTGLEAAAADGDLTPGLIEAYMPLGLVPESLAVKP